VLLVLIGGDHCDNGHVQGWSQLLAGTAIPATQVEEVSDDFVGWLLTEFIFDWHVEVLNEDNPLLVVKTLSILNGHRHEVLLVCVWVDLELHPPL
jgi:hypothetical protein